MLFESYRLFPTNDSVDGAGGGVYECPILCMNIFRESFESSGLLLCGENAGEETILYSVRHNERGVGITSRRFCDLIASALRRSGAPPPKRITGVHVEFVDAVAGNGATGAAHGLGVAGVWSRVRICGLGEFGT